MTTHRKKKFLFKLKFSVLILFSASLFVACSSLQTSQNYFLNKTEGLVFFSMTESGVLSSHYQLTFINESTKSDYVVSLRKGDHYEIGFNEDDKAHNRSFDNPIGKLVILRLPEGVYSLKKWSTKEKKKTGKHSQAHSPEKKFRVMNGHSLYLGNLHLLNSEKQSSLLIMDNRSRDLSLFYKHYPQADKSKLLITFRLFLDPAAGRHRIFDAYTGCGIKDYTLFSKKRLPQHIEKFRTLRIGDKDKKISRIDGYRLKFRAAPGKPGLSIKVELSDAKSYVTDKKVTKAWFDEVNKKIKGYDTSFEKKSFFSEFQLKTNSLKEHGMIYMVTMFDDASQIITNIVFVNPPEYARSYETVEAFMPDGLSAVTSFQQCVIESLNQHL